MTILEMISQIKDMARQMLRKDDNVFTAMVDELDSWNGFANGFRCYLMDELEEIHYGMKLTEFLKRVTGGFKFTDAYFYYSDYGLESTADRVELYRDNVDIDELLDEILQHSNDLWFSDPKFESIIRCIQELTTLSELTKEE